MSNEPTAHDIEMAQASVDEAILRVVLPQAYAVINELLQAEGKPSKELVARARRLLPRQYAMAFGTK